MGSTAVAAPKKSIRGTIRVPLIGQAFIARTWGARPQPELEEEVPPEYFLIQLPSKGKPRYGIPADWFQHMLVESGNMIGLSKARLSSAFTVRGELASDGETPCIELRGQPEIDRRLVRAKGSKERGWLYGARYAEGNEWRATLVVEYNEAKITPGHLTRLILWAGAGSAAFVDMTFNLLR